MLFWTRSIVVRHCAILDCVLRIPQLRGVLLSVCVGTVCMRGRAVHRVCTVGIAERVSILRSGDVCNLSGDHVGWGAIFNETAGNIHSEPFDDLRTE